MRLVSSSSGSNSRLEVALAARPGRSAVRSSAGGTCGVHTRRPSAAGNAVDEVGRGGRLAHRRRGTPGWPRADARLQRTTASARLSMPMKRPWRRGGAQRQRHAGAHELHETAEVALRAGAVDHRRAQDHPLQRRCPAPPPSGAAPSRAWSARRALAGAGASSSVKGRPGLASPCTSAELTSTKRRTPRAQPRPSEPRRALGVDAGEGVGRRRRHLVGQVREARPDARPRRPRRVPRPSGLRGRPRHSRPIARRREPPPAQCARAAQHVVARAAERLGHGPAQKARGAR